MQDLTNFPKNKEVKQNIINQRVAEISNEMRSTRISVSSNVKEYIMYPSYISDITYGNILDSSVQKMDIIYEKVMSFLGNLNEEEDF